MSVFLGWLGVDRFYMWKIFTGVLKLIWFIVFFFAAGLLIATDISKELTSLIVISFIIYLFLFWWIGDIIYIATGAAKVKGLGYLR